MPRTSNSLPRVVVAVPPMTTAVAALGEIVRPLVEVAHFELTVSRSLPQVRLPFASVSMVSQETRALTWRVERRPVVEKRFVEEAVVLKRLVVVALVPVAFTKVTFWRVVEPVAVMLVTAKRVAVALVVVALSAVKLMAVEEAVERKPPRVERPVTESVPAEEREAKLPAPEEVTLPTVRAVAKRLVEEAVVAKKLVEVAF